VAAAKRAFTAADIYARGRRTPYVTGGVAVGEVMTAGTVFGFGGDGNPVNTIGGSTTKAGLTVGGGLEARLFGNWTGKLEYL
jgi:opacity protein-like surface antigen